MAAPAILKIDIIADATKAVRGLKDAGGAAQTTGSKISGIGKAVAGGFAAGAVVAFAGSAVKAANDASKSGARLDQIFRSMGESTNDASKAAQDYAGSLSKKIGVDDDAIMAAQAQLATFGAVSDATARQAGIFDRATAAAADLAAAGFGSLDTNAVQLGKALQNPSKGITALAKSGVTFTDAQKQQIAAMQKSGDLLGAQKIVMGAVEQQVKGTAAATATGADKMNVAWGETQESVGNALLPVLNELLPVLTKVMDFIAKNTSWIVPLAVAIGVLAVAWNIASVAATLFGTSMLAALWPVLLVIAAIAALVAIGIVIAKNWETIKAVALGVWHAILGAVQAVWAWIKANWPMLLAILTGPFGVAVLLIVRNWDAIKSAVSAAFNFVKSVWSKIQGVLTAPFSAAWGVIKAVIDKVSGAISGALSAAESFASRIAGALKGPLNTIIRAWNRLGIPGFTFHIPLPGPIPDISFHWDGLSLPDIPELARGGTVLRTGLALVHAGEQFSGVGNTFGGATVVHVHVTTTGLGADSPRIQRDVVQAIRGYVDRNGALPIPTRAAS